MNNFNRITNVSIFLIFHLATVSLSVFAQTDNKESSFRLQRTLSQIDESNRLLKIQRESPANILKMLDTYNEAIKKMPISPEIDLLRKQLLDAWTMAERSKWELKSQNSLLNKIRSLFEKFLEPIAGYISKKMRATELGLKNSDDRIVMKAILSLVYNSIKDGPSIVKQSYEKLIAEKEDANGFPEDVLISKNRKDLDVFLTSISPIVFSEYINAASQTIENNRLELKKEIDQYTKQINDNDANIKNLEERISAKEEGQMQIDKVLIQYALPVFGLVMIVLFLFPLWFGRPDLQTIIFSSGILLELITVFLLTATILILGLGGKIQGEVLGTLLGGISGYILGRSIKKNKE